MQITHEAERHFSQSTKEDGFDDEDDDENSSKEGKAKIIVKLLKCLLVLTCNQGRVSLENIRRGT